MKTPQLPPLEGCSPLGVSPNGRPYSDIDSEIELIPAADIPFNLAGELLDESLNAEGERQANARAEAEARKAQYCLIFAPIRKSDGSYTQSCRSCGFPESAHYSKSAANIVALRKD